MRRSAPSQTISPKMVKHFAAVTVIATVIMATLGANAQGEFDDSKGAATQSGEPEKSSGLATEMRVSKKSSGSGSWGSDGDDVGSGSVDPDGGGGSSQTGRYSASATLQTVLPPQLPAQAGATVTVTGTARAELPGASITKPTDKRLVQHAYMPDEDEQKAIAEASRSRTSGDGSGALQD